MGRGKVLNSSHSGMILILRWQEESFSELAELLGESKGYQEWSQIQKMTGKRHKNDYVSHFEDGFEFCSYCERNRGRAYVETKVRSKHNQRKERIYKLKTTIIRFWGEFLTKMWKLLEFLMICCEFITSGQLRGRDDPFPRSIMISIRY